MNCHEYELQIGDAVDGTLDGSSERVLDAHLAVCERCRRIAGDLRAIRAASRSLAFDDRSGDPEPGRGVEPRVPPPHVWTRLAAAIDADAQRPAWFSAWLRGGRIPWPQLAAATVAVMLVAGVAWMTWRDVGPGTAADGITAGVNTGAGADVDPAPDPISNPNPNPNPEPEIALEHAEDQYVTAITGLEEITKAGGTELDLQTADVLQANLTVIDQAIDESRAALQAEPASDLAQESLFGALRSKVALLQDAVALINEMRKGNQEGAARIVGGLNQ